MDESLEGRRVGFVMQSEDGKREILTPGASKSDDGESGPEEEEEHERPSRLHRRDTPHHLKNKRISATNRNADIEKVASIIAQVWL